MPNLNTILQPLVAAERDRIAAAMKLLNLQALGSERYREEARCWTKEDKSPVSVADLLHQSQVQQLLHDRFPGDGLVSEEPRAMQEKVVEEASAVSARFYGSALRPSIQEVPARGEITWMLDPIDGTKGYLAGRYYAIALGYFAGDRVRFGAMAVPHAPRAEATAIDNMLAFAIAGVGAWIGPVREAGELEFEPLRTQAPPEAPPYRVAISLEHAGKLGEAVSGGDFQSVKLDSQAKYLAVAANVLDAYARQSRDDGGTDVAWDHVPGALIAAEAGCTVANFDQSPIEFRPEPIVRFRGGMLCHRGAATSALGGVLRRVLAAG